MLPVAIGVPEWAFNYVLPQFRLGSNYLADFIVVAGQSNSYEITIVELKRPEASLYTKQGIISNDLNFACTEIDNYRRWIVDSTEDFKKNLVAEISKEDPAFEDTFDWTRRFRIYSKVVIGRRENLTGEILDKNFDLENKGVSVISYDRLIDTEKRLLEMHDKGVGLYYYRNDERIKNVYDIELENKQLEHDNIGTDNVLF